MPGVAHRSMGSSFRSGSISDSAPGPALATTAPPLPPLCRRRPCSRCCCGCATFILSCFTAPWRWRAPAAADGDAEMPDTTLLLLIISLQALSLALSAPSPLDSALYISLLREKSTLDKGIGHVPSRNFAAFFLIHFSCMEINRVLIFFSNHTVETGSHTLTHARPHEHNTRNPTSINTSERLSR